MWGRFFIRQNRVPKNAHQKRTNSSIVTGPAGQVGLGALLLGAGISILTINERRRVKQNQLREKGKELCLPLDADNGELEPLNNALGSSREIGGKTEGSWSGLILQVISHAEVFSDETLLDPTFQVSHPDALKMKRDTQMFQWIETSTKVTRMFEKFSTMPMLARAFNFILVPALAGTDGKQIEEIKYSYTKGWSSNRESFVGPEPPIKSNPAFPSWLPPGISTMSVEKFLFGLKRLFLSSTLVNQLEDYTALPLTQDTCKYNGDDFVISRGNTLYSKGRNPTSPEVGDIIVKYTFVAKGKHTLVSKFLVDKGFVPFEGKLKKSLRDEGEIKAPEQVKELTGGQPLVIPPWVIKMAEDVVLSLAPLQLCWIKRGLWTKKDAFDSIEKHDEETTNGMRFFGGAVVVGGAYNCLRLMPIVSKESAFGTALFLGRVLGKNLLLSMRKMKETLQQEDALAKCISTLESGIGISYQTIQDATAGDRSEAEGDVDLE